MKDIQNSRLILAFILIGTLTVLLLSTFTSAFSYQEITRNAYDFSAMEGVQVEVYQLYINGTLLWITSDVSDSEGIIRITSLSSANYSIRSSKPGWNSQTWINYMNESTDRIVYMTEASISTLKIKYSDLTARNGRLTLYDNQGRIYGVYNTNSTIRLAAGNYTAYLEKSMVDEAYTHTGLLGLLYSIWPFIGIVLVIIGIIGVLLFGAYKVSKRR